MGAGMNRTQPVLDQYAVGFRVMEDKRWVLVKLRSAPLWWAGSGTV